MDPDLYAKCEEEYEQTCLEKRHHDAERQHRWLLIQQAAQSGHLTQTPDQNQNHIELEPVEMQIDSSSVAVPAKVVEDAEMERVEEEGKRTSEETGMVVDEVGVGSAVQ